MADARIERTINTHDTATVPDDITINDATSTTIAVANLDRIVFEFFNLDKKRVRLKLQAASVDNDVKGIPVDPGETWFMPTDNIYDGEISAISEDGDRQVTFEEY